MKCMASSILLLKIRAKSLEEMREVMANKIRKNPSNNGRQN